MEELVENISSIISKLYLSVENKGYDILMKISDISENLFSQNPLNIIYNDTYRIYIDLFIKVVIFSFFIFYFLKLLLYLYSENGIENLYYFIIKVIIVLILSSNSYYICQKAVYFNFLLTDTISKSLENIANIDISYNYIKEEKYSLQEIIEFDDKTNIEGVIDIIISFFVINMIIFLCVRYVVVILSILISPFSFLMILSKETRKLFFIWLKCLVFSLLIQVVNKLLLFIIIISKDNKEMFSAILIGTLFIMYRLNRSFLYAKDK